MKRRRYEANDGKRQGEHVDFSLQMTMGELKAHVATNANREGNLWCHLKGCHGTYTPYRVNMLLVSLCR